MNYNYATATVGDHYANTPWYFSRNNEITVTFEEGITSIGNNMFKDCTGIKEIILPSSLTSIGTYALAGTMIEEIEIPQSITTISNGLFSGCTAIKEYEIQNHITSIGESSFSGCTGLKEIVIPDSVTSLSMYSFSGCTSLEKLTVPISLNCAVARANTSVQHSCFYNVTNIKEIYFTKGTGEGFNYTTNTVGEHYARTPWYFSKDIEGGITVTFEGGITSIGDNMFKDCTGLNKIIYKNNEYINLESFQSVFVNTDGGTISSSAFTGSGF